MIETRTCVICGKEYQPKRRNGVTCCDPECKRRLNIQRATQWHRDNTEQTRAIKREYMRRKRAEEEQIKQGVNTFKAAGYAERQIAKLLAMAGNIEV